MMFNFHANDDTVQFMKLLCSSLDVLTCSNVAAVTPLKRMKAWAYTAVDGRPFQPAVDFLEELVILLDIVIDFGSLVLFKELCPQLS